MEPRIHSTRSGLWGCRRLVAIAVILACLSRSGAAAEDAASDTDIYSNDDLILVNPIQSSGILLCIIVASTFIEFVFDKFSQLRNRYLRAIYNAIREELTVISFGVMSLQFVVNSFPGVSSEWRVVVEWVALCSVYLAFCYCLLVGTIVFILKLRSKGWRTFEWARIDADSHHSQSEQVFKLARKYFVMEIACRLDETHNELVSIPPVAFSSYVTLLEVDVLEDLLNFSIKTWLFLAIVIFANATRSMTVASLDPDSRATSHIVSFIIMIGYLTLAAHIGMGFLLQHRIRAFTVQQLDPQEYDEKADAPTACLLFGTENRTLEAFKAVLLTSIWYLCVFIMCFGYVAYDRFGALSVLVYIFAVAPPVIIVLTTPYVLNLVTFCSAMAVSKRDHAIAHLASGGVVFDDVPSSDDDSDDDDLDARVKVSKRDQQRSAAEAADDDDGPRRRRPAAGGREGDGGYLNLVEYDDTEYNGPTVSLNGADGGLLEEMKEAEKTEMDRSRLNNFGYEREPEDSGGMLDGSHYQRFHDSRIHFRD